MKKLFAIALFVVLGNAQAAAPFSLQLQDGNVVGVQMVNERELVMVANPDRACTLAPVAGPEPIMMPGTVSNITAQDGMLILLEGSVIKSGAAWSMGSASPRNMPAWAGGYGVEICKWWKANKK